MFFVTGQIPKQRVMPRRMSFSCRHSVDVVLQSKQMRSEHVSSPKINKTTGLIKHVCRCQDRSCKIPMCMQLRRIMGHMKVCCGETNRSTLCQEAYIFCAEHMRRCESDDCVLIEFCKEKQQPQLEPPSEPSSKIAKFVVV